MEQLISTFGIDAKLILAQIINFVVLAAALTYFLYTPLLNTIRKRQETIEQGVKDAEDAAAAKSVAEEEKQSILTQAHKDAEEVGANAKTYADEKAQTILANAETKASEVMQTAEEKGNALQEKARKESEAEIAKMAVLATETLLRERSEKRS